MVALEFLWSFLTQPIFLALYMGFGAGTAIVLLVRWGLPPR